MVVDQNVGAPSAADKLAEPRQDLVRWGHVEIGQVPEAGD